MKYKKDDYEHMSFMQKTGEKYKGYWKRMPTIMKVKWAVVVFGGIITSIAGLVTIYINVF